MDPTLRFRADQECINPVEREIQEINWTVLLYFIKNRKTLIQFFCYC
jgi:hypothetical protein